MWGEPLAALDDVGLHRTKGAEQLFLLARTDLEEASGLILGRSLDAIDGQHPERRAVGDQLEPELLLEGSEERRIAVARRRLLSECQGEFVSTSQPGPVEDDAAVRGSDAFRESG